jgi:hypothetical protein
MDAANRMVMATVALSALADVYFDRRFRAILMPTSAAPAVTRAKGPEMPAPGIGAMQPENAVVAKVVNIADKAAN